MIRTTSKIYLENGKSKKISEFKEDTEGKIIYEVIRIIDGKPLFLEDHYARMKYSFELSEVELKITENELKKQIEKIVKESSIKEGNIKLTYCVQTDTFKLFFIKHKYPTKVMYKEGVNTILYFGERENPNAKIVNNEFRSKVNEQIKQRDAFEAILVSNNGLVTEGSKSNIFFIKDGHLYTSKVQNVLPGVTRTEIITMAIKLNIKIIEEDFNYLKVNEADAAFISGTSPKILPIKKVEDHEYDVNNELLQKLIQNFDKKIEDYIKNYK